MKPNQIPNIHTIVGTFLILCILFLFFELGMKISLGTGIHFEGGNIEIANDPVTLVLSLAGWGIILFILALVANALLLMAVLLKELHSENKSSNLRKSK